MFDYKKAKKIINLPDNLTEIFDLNFKSVSLAKVTTRYNGCRALFLYFGKLRNIVPLKNMKKRKE
jgi:hypothetical protein